MRDLYRAPRSRCTCFDCRRLAIGKKAHSYRGLIQTPKLPLGWAFFALRRRTELSGKPLQRTENTKLTWRWPEIVFYGLTSRGWFTDIKACIWAVGQVTGQRVGQSQIPSDSVPWVGPPGLRVVGRENTLIYPLNRESCFWFEAVWTPWACQKLLTVKTCFLAFTRTSTKRQQEANRRKQTSMSTGMWIQ